MVCACGKAGEQTGKGMGMNCYHCGAPLTGQDFCSGCGADVKRYKRIMSLSNRYYNDGLEKAGVRDLSGAVVSLTECLKLNKENTDARNLLGLVYFEMGETVAALSEWVLSKNMKPEDNAADDYIGAVQDSPTQLDNLNQAVRKYNQALTYCRQGSLDLAVLQLKKVLSLHSRFLKAHQLLALLYIHGEEWEKARRELNKCSRIDVRNTTTLRYLKEVSRALNTGEAARESGKSRRTEEVIKYQSGNETIIQPLNVADNKKSCAWILYLLGGAVLGLAVALTLILPARMQSLKAQQNEESRQIGEQLDKKNAQLADLEAQVEALQAGNAELSGQLESFSGTDGTLQTVEALLNAACIYLDTPEDLEKTAEALEKINPDSIQAEELPQASRDLYEQLLAEVGPGISQASYKSGSAAYRSGDYDTAIQDLEHAFSYDKSNSDALLLLGNAYRRKGDSGSAVSIYRQVTELFPNTEAARRAAGYIEELEA